MAVRVPSPVPAVLLACIAPCAFAAHPLQTEDTGTQGAGNIEIENGLSSARFDSTTLSVYQPQLSVGLATTVDAIVQPSYEWRRTPPGRVSGWGDTNVDAKWRFWGSDPLSLAVRAGVAVATSQDGFGLARGKTSEHGLLALTWDATPTTVHANVGATYVPRGAASQARRAMAQVSGAVMQALNESLILTVNAQFAQNPDSHRANWPGSALAGAIWTARPGLDLDIGWQRSIDDRPVTRTWLAGLTYRFSL